MMNKLRTQEQQQEIHERYDFMIETVHELGELALDMIDNRQVKLLDLKPDSTKVTTADVALNERFIKRVAERYPGDLVWGEEKSNSEKGDTLIAARHWMWLIDPIDGTSGFWRSYGNRRFRECNSTVMITGFAPSETTPTMSVIHNPFQDQKVTISADAYRAYYQSSDMHEPLEIHTRGAGPANLDAVRRYEKSNWNDSVPDLSRISEIISGAREYNHQLFMGSVALGDVDLSVFPGPSHPHDVAPGALIVHNAGGSMTTFKGELYEDVDWRVYPIAGTIATVNQGLADEVVEAYESQVVEQVYRA